MDNTPMLDLVKYVCSKWKLQPKQATGDAKYGTVPNIAGLEEMGIKAFLPTPDLSKRSGFFPLTFFNMTTRRISTFALKVNPYRSFLGEKQNRFWYIELK
jgi:hypothetical protein